MSSHVEDGMLLAYKRLRTAYDVSLAENQRLREALEQIEDGVYVAQGQPAAAYMQKVAREALAGDAE